MPVPVVVQLWEESERGWGVRPDGYSLHRNNADKDAFIAAYWESQPDAVGGYAPDEYSRPRGSGYIADVDETTYAEIIKSRYGIRKMGSAPK